METHNFEHDDHMSDHEMREVVQLLAARQREADRRLDMPSVTEVSEALSVPADRVRAALEEVRMRSRPAPPVIAPAPVFVEPPVAPLGVPSYEEEQIAMRRRRSTNSSLIALAVAVAFFLVFFIAAMVAFHPHRSVTVGPVDGPIIRGDDSLMIRDEKSGKWRQPDAAERATMQTMQRNR